MRSLFTRVNVYILWIASFALFLSWYSVYADLLDTAFQPSKNLDQVINIWNSKNAVGNEVFRGSTSVIADLWLFPHCFKPVWTVQANCAGKKWVAWKAKSNTCYQIPPMADVDKNACTAQWWEWTTVAYSEFVKRDSLVVRITKTLLRLVIALAIPMIIFLWVRTIMSAFNGGDYKAELKNVVIVVVGLILALSAIGIIYFIQSLTIQSLSGAPSPF